MTEPSVCALMLTRDRPAMARRAAECFRAQTYQKKALLIFDSGNYLDWLSLMPAGHDPKMIGDFWHEPHEPATIGELRNAAIEHAVAWDKNAFPGSDIICHFDDDDYSHPNRIAEQVALLQSSGADCVGYREMLFFDQRESECDCIPGRLSGGKQHGNCATDNYGSGRGRAWIYIAQGPEPQLLGTSLCYWRKSWERQPFEAISQGEDAKFCAGIRCFGISATTALIGRDGDPENGSLLFAPNGQPRMIARIHGGNTSTGYTAQNFRAAEWRRAPKWDSYCRQTMEIR